MVRFSCLKFSAAAGAVLAVLAVGNVSARADEALTNLGPVGPREPILATVGDKRIIAYYEPDGDECAVSAVLFDASEEGGGSASTRIRVALHPGEIFNFDAVENHRVVLTCAPTAGMLIVLNRGELVTKEARLD